MRCNSIRSRLILGIFIVVALMLGVAALTGYLGARHEADELFDAELAQYARTLQPLLENPAAPTGLLFATPPQPGPEEGEAGKLGHSYERKLFFRLTTAEGRLLRQSPLAPAGVIQTAPGFAGLRDQNRNWRTFSFVTSAGNWLQVGEDDSIRADMAEKIAHEALHPLLIALPLLLLLIWWQIRQGTQSMTRLAQLIGERHPANLKPLQWPQPTRELQPLVDELNRLMRALADALEHEKQFTNIAAHELRTPLAVLRIHGENALASGDPHQREQSLHKMLAALDRGDRLLRQLLTQARIDNQSEIETEVIALLPLLRDTLANLAPLALQKDQDLGLDETAPDIKLSGNPVLLGLLFANLVDNAIRYTPVGGEILVQVRERIDEVQITVSDSGPGVPPALLPRLRERFYRVNPQEGDGAGLGLSIVSRIIELHRARLEIHNRKEGGLVLTVSLPVHT